LDTQTTLPAVQLTYEELDRSVSRFAEKSKMKCPGGCGRCCESPFIEATPVECLPLAQSLLPKADEWLPLLRTHVKIGRKLPSSCPFYVSFGFGKGFCSVYDNRPFICRMYGFAAFVDEKGTEQLDSCHLHSDRNSQLPSPDPDGSGQNKAPLYRDYKRRLKKLSAEHSEPTGIAEAVLRALEILVQTRG
jgi:Fe-S-cluster containining protein